MLDGRSVEDRFPFHEYSLFNVKFMDYEDDNEYSFKLSPSNDFCTVWNGKIALGFGKRKRSA